MRRAQLQSMCCRGVAAWCRALAPQYHHTAARPLRRSWVRKGVRSVPIGGSVASSSVTGGSVGGGLVDGAVAGGPVAGGSVTGSS
eukprot:367142-Prymnesium_polylepis.1